MAPALPRPLVIYVDIDDTLVRSFGSKRIPMTSMVERVRGLHAEGATLYAWSSGGGDYARETADELGIRECFVAFLPKPSVLIDDVRVSAWQTIETHPNEAMGLTVDDYLRRLAWVAPAPPAPSTVTLYRPTGPTDLALIEASGFRRFPPRLPDQPIFYPVCNEAYAREIAAKWNVDASGAGFVTRFEVDAAFLAAYDRRIVGSTTHEEYWIPADQLEAFNDAIVGRIDVVARFP